MAISCLPTTIIRRFPPSIIFATLPQSKWPSLRMLKREKKRKAKIVRFGVGHILGNRNSNGRFGV